MSLDTCVYTAHIMLYTLVTRIAYHYAVEEYSSRDCTIQIRTPVTKLMCNNIKYFHETNRLSSQTIIKYFTGRVRVMVFNVTINNISAIWWRSVYWWRKPEYSEKTTNLSQVIDKLNVVSSTPLCERDSNSPH